MFALLNITAPLFLLIAVGFGAVKYKILPNELLPGISRFVLYFCIPGTILSNFFRNTPSEILDFKFIFTYGTASLLALAALALFQRFILGNSGPHIYLFSIGGAVPNSMFIGFPILLQVLPEVAGQVLVMAVLVENLLILPIGLILTEFAVAKADANNGSQILTKVLNRLVTNPILIAVGVGLFISVLRLPVPEFLEKALNMLSSSAASAALLVIGGSLVGNKIRGDMTTIGMITATKLVLHPIAALFTLSLWADFDPQMKAAMVLISAVPMLSIFPILGNNLGVGKVCASTLLIATIVSFFT